MNRRNLAHAGANNIGSQRSLAAVSIGSADAQAEFLKPPGLPRASFDNQHSQSQASLTPNIMMNKSKLDVLEQELTKGTTTLHSRSPPHMQSKGSVLLKEPPHKITPGSKLPPRGRLPQLSNGPSSIDIDVYSSAGEKARLTQNNDGMTETPTAASAAEAYGLSAKTSAGGRPPAMFRKNMINQPLDINAKSQGGHRAKNQMATLPAESNGNKKQCENCGRQFNSKMFELHKRACERAGPSASNALRGVGQASLTRL